MTRLHAVAGVSTAARLLLLLAATLLVAGCSPDASGLPLPPEGPEVAVEITEDAVTHERPVPAGRVVFRVSNAGEEPHQLSLLALAEDAPSIEEQLADPPETRPALIARVPPVRPGGTGMFAARLAAGQRYALVDLSEAADGSLHAELGVATEFRAEDPEAPGTS